MWRGGTVQKRNGGGRKLRLRYRTRKERNRQGGLTQVLPQVFLARAGFFATAHGRPDGVPGRIPGAREKSLRRDYQRRPSMTELHVTVERL